MDALQGEKGHQQGVNKNTDKGGSRSPDIVNWEKTCGKLLLLFFMEHSLSGIPAMVCKIKILMLLLEYTKSIILLPRRNQTKFILI